MSALLLNRDGFQMPADGWYQLAPLGEFPHASAGVIQVVDVEACTAMAARFKADTAVANFAGLLVDFDHFSLDDRARSEAAGWIMELEGRATGLWAKIRWSDVGEEAVKGGRYRFLSPVWARSECVDLGPSTGSGQETRRVRPVRLLNAAVTNDPNLKGLVPLANSGPVDSCASYRGAHISHGKDGQTMKRVIEKLTNHLGIPGDATEDVILEKMLGLPGLTVVADLQNSLKQALGERDALQKEFNGAEDELVNRHLAEFEGVISDATKPFWAEQLLKNRDLALTALADIASLRQAGRDEPTPASGHPSKEGIQSATRRPLHNRATARPVIPGQGGASTGSAGAGAADGRAGKIRNRAHEIAKGEKIPFSVAFRRAEKEVLEG
jgi:hypothetical protein